MSTIRSTCRCGHDKTTHHEGAHNCLASWCLCKAYEVPGPRFSSGQLAILNHEEDFYISATD
jgi:hypothetical protein